MRLSFFFLTLPIFLTAQINQDFSSNALTNWLGDTSRFGINGNQQLQLQDSAFTNEAIIYTANDIALESVEWELWVNLEFSPSSSNQLKVFLASDTTTLSDNFKGYYLEIGESGSSDAVNLIRQDSIATSAILSGLDGTLSKSNNVFKLKIIRNELSKWFVFLDTSATLNNYVLQDSIVDSTYKSSKYFGLSCKHTASRADKFYFDDIYVGSIRVDTVAPKVDSFEIVGNNSLFVYFNETLDSSTLELNNFILSPSLGTIDTVYFHSVTNTVFIKFQNDFVDEIHYELTMTNVLDLNGNDTSIVISFTKFYTDPYEIVINELFADPDPQIGLPEHEFIELHNTTHHDINLGDWKISDQTTTVILPKVIIAPDSFLILCPADADSLYQLHGKTLPLSSWPSLNNSGDIITLRDENGQTIHKVQYAENWHDDNLKKLGGWSLEMIDPLNPCEGENNWKSSENNLGGTPGKINSVQDVNPDITAPKLSKLFVLDSSTIQLTFSEELDPEVLNNYEYFNISPNDIEVQTISILDSFTILKLILSPELESKVIYTLRLDSLSDCSGNLISSDLHRFGISEPADSFDIIINEILPNPKTGGEDFVEIYNQSDKILDLKDIRMANRGDNGAIDQVIIPSEESWLFFPQDHIVLTENNDELISSYYVPNRDLIVTTSLPSYPDDTGNVVLLDKKGNILDEFAYSEDMHLPLLDVVDGVSLERLSHNAPTQDQNNWHSATSTAGFATPTYSNSTIITTSNIDQIFFLEPDVISPNGDGYNDLLNIHYHVDEPNYVLNIEIFDIDGNYIHHLVKSNSLDNKGFFIWDGTNSEGKIVVDGVYIFLVKLFHVEKGNQIYKFACGVMTKS